MLNHKHMNHVRGGVSERLQNVSATTPRRHVMGVLQQREGRTAVVALRVLSSLKTQFQVLRKPVDAPGSI